MHTNEYHVFVETVNDKIMLIEHHEPGIGKEWG